MTLKFSIGNFFSSIQLLTDPAWTLQRDLLSNTNKPFRWDCSKKKNYELGDLSVNHFIKYEIISISFRFYTGSVTSKNYSDIYSVSKTIKARIFFIYI